MSRLKTSWAVFSLCFAAHLAAQTPFEMSLAEPCEGAADSAKKVLIPVVDELKTVQPPTACFVAGTAIVLSATDVRATSDQFGAGSVEVKLTPASMRRFSRIKSTHLGKQLILLRGKEAVLYFRISEASSDDKFILYASSLHQAETIVQVLRGEGER